MTLQPDGSFIWTGQVMVGSAWDAANPNLATIPPLIGGSVSNISNHIGANPNDWRSIAPKQNNLNVVKLTKDNFVRIARSLVEKNGPIVSVKADYFTYEGQTFAVGDFLVKDYDYRANADVIRKATLTERETYDLR